MRVGWLFVLASILFTPRAARAQAQAGQETPEQLSALIKRVRARPDDKAETAEANALAYQLLAASRYEDALSIFKVILEGVPREQKALYGGALALFNLRRLEEAETLAGEAVEASRAEMTSINRARGESDVEFKRRTADALVLLGVILAVKKDDGGALKAVTEAVALAPDNFDAQLALGRARYGAGDPTGAALAFRAAVALKPGDVQSRFFLATALEGSGDTDGALAAYRELLLLRPESAEGHLGLGVLLFKLGGAKTDEGINELARAVALSGDLYEARVTLGRALVAKGRNDEALEHLRRAASLAPQNPEPHYQLAIAYRRLGKMAEAAAETAAVQRIHQLHRGANPGTGPNED